MRSCFLLLMISFLFSGCKPKQATLTGILKPDKMQEVFWDYIRVDVYAHDFIKKDLTKNPVFENLKLQEKIFKQHHITKEDFYKSYTYYSNHKELMTRLMDSIISKQERIVKITKPD